MYSNSLSPLFFPFCFILWQFVVKRVNILFFLIEDFYFGFYVRACIFLIRNGNIYGSISLTQWVGLHRLQVDGIVF